MILSRPVRIGVPAIVIAGLIASLVSFYSVQRDLVEARDNHRGGPLWLVVRLEFSLLQFDSALANYAAQAPGVTVQDVNQRFDTLWSRWDLAHHGKAGAWLREIDMESNVIASLGRELAKQELRVVNLQPSDLKSAFDLQAAFAAYQDPMRDLSLAALRETSDTEVAVREHLVSSANKLTFISAAIVLISLILVGYFYLNALAQRRIAQEKSKLFIQAQAGYKAKSEFVATISHELRTPLTSIIGAFDLLGSGVIVKLPDKADGLVKLGRGGCDRLSKLIENLLDIEMFENGALKLAVQSFDLLEMLEDVKEEVKPDAAKKKIDIQTDIQGDYFEVEADFRRLSQAVCAVLDNAIKFSDQGQSVTVALRAVQPSSFEITIKDQGIGIAANQHKRIFDKFTLGDSSDQRAHAGVGNGLFIADAIIKAHGGSIRVNSEEGAGTEMIMSFPAQSVQEESMTNQEPVAEVA